MFSSSSTTMTSTYPLPIAFTNYAAGPITLPSSSARAAQFLFPFCKLFSSQHRKTSSDSQNCI